MDRLEAALATASAAAPRRCRPGGRLPARRRPRARATRHGSSCSSPTSPTPRRPTGSSTSTARWRWPPRGPLTPAGVPRRDRHEPQVRHGDPRRPRPARRSCAGPRPATSPGRERAWRQSGRRMTEGRVTGAVVLAGGRSSRFGRDKLAEPIDGRSLLDHAIDAVRPLAAEVLVVAAPGRGARPAAGRADRARPGRLRRPAGGPAGRALGRAGAAVLVVGGDMPTLVGEVLAAMLVELDGHGGRGGRAQSTTVGPAVADGRPARARGDRRCAALLDRRRVGCGHRPRRSQTRSSPKRPGARLDPDGRDAARHRHARRPGLIRGSGGRQRNRGHTKTSAGGSGGRRVLEGGAEGWGGVSPRTGSS